MTVGAPYRESDVIDVVERACPMCGARVRYAATDTSAECAACDTRFAVSVGELSKSEPRQHLPDGERAPLPLSAEGMALEKMTEDALATFAADERSRLKAVGLVWVTVTTVIIIIGGIVTGAL